MIDRLATFVPSVLFAAAAVAAALDLRRRGAVSRYSVLVLIVAAVVTRVATFLEPGLCPVSGTGGGMGIVALFLALHLIFGFRPGATDQAKVLVLVLIACLLDLGGQLIEPSAPTQAPRPRERAFAELHGGFVLIAYAAFAVAGVYSLLYHILYRVMKQRRIGFWFDRLPSLSTLETKSSVSVRVGFVALTFGLVIGFFTFASFQGGVPGDPKVIFAAALWVLFAADVLSRFLLGWRGIRVMWIPLAGTLMIAVLYSLGRTDHPFWSPS